MNIKINWQLNEVETYNVNFNTNGGNSIQPQIVTKGETVTKPNNPIKEGYVFVEWTLEGKTYNFDSAVYSDISLLATWKIKEEEIITYKVTFDSDNGTEIQEQIVEEGSQLKEPEEPKKEEHKFEGWYFKGEKFNFETEITEDIELIAKWKKIEKVTITFDTNGGSNINKQTISKGDKVSKPTDPTKKYYKLVEWQLNGKKYNFNQEVNSNITLKAIWKEDLPTNLPVPKVKIEGDLFHRVGVANTDRCEYEVKLTNYKDYLYQKEDGSYAYFIDAFEIIREDGVGLMGQDNIEEPLIMDVTCGKSVNIYFEVIRKAEDYMSGGKVEAKATSKVITIDTKADLTPKLELGRWRCKYKEFCEVLYADGLYEYKLDILDSVGMSFDDGTVEIYEKVGNDYIFVGIALDEPGLHVKIAPNTVKTYVARAYIENDMLGKVYGNYSNELVIDTSKETSN